MPSKLEKALKLIMTLCLITYKASKVLNADFSLGKHWKDHKVNGKRQFWLSVKHLVMVPIMFYGIYINSEGKHNSWKQHELHCAHSLTTNKALSSVC